MFKSENFLLTLKIGLGFTSTLNLNLTLVFLDFNFPTVCVNNQTQILMKNAYKTSKPCNP
jgi:hypothetical protein